MNNEVDDFEAFLKTVSPEMFKTANIYNLLKVTFLEGKLSGFREGVNVRKTVAKAMGLES